MCRRSRYNESRWYLGFGTLLIPRTRIESLFMPFHGEGNTTILVLSDGNQEFNGKCTTVLGVTTHVHSKLVEFGWRGLPALGVERPS